MSIKEYYGLGFYANENESRLYVQMETGDRVDITDLLQDFMIHPDNDIPGAYNITLKSQVVIE